MDLMKLRNLVSLVVGDPASYTHQSLPGDLARLGLPVPPDDGSKRVRIEGSLAAEERHFRRADAEA
jgi:hypothetical protein